MRGTFGSKAEVAVSRPEVAAPRGSPIGRVAMRAPRAALGASWGFPRGWDATDATLARQDRERGLTRFYARIEGGLRRQ